MVIEDWMGLLLFIFGLILITIAFLAVIDITDLIDGLSVVGFSILGFILCVTGFVMARTVMGDTIQRIRDR